MWRKRVLQKKERERKNAANWSGILVHLVHNNHLVIMCLEIANLIALEHKVLSHRVGQFLLKLGDLVHKLLLTIGLQDVALLRLLFKTVAFLINILRS